MLPPKQLTLTDDVILATNNEGSVIVTTFVNDIGFLDDEISNCEGEEIEEDEDEVVEEEIDCLNEVEGRFGFVENNINIDSEDAIYSINMQNLTHDHLQRIHFVDLETTYNFLKVINIAKK